MTQLRRRKLLVDKRVQIGILIRVGVYFLFCVLFITLPLAFVHTIFDPSSLWVEHVVQVWKNHWSILAMMTLIFPFAYYDLLKFSNRFVGPIYRLRLTLHEYEKHGKFNKIKFRSHDFWPDLADGFNMLGNRIIELEEKLKQYESESAQSVQ